MIEWVLQLRILGCSKLAFRRVKPIFGDLQQSGFYSGLSRETQICHRGKDTISVIARTTRIERLHVIHFLVNDSSPGSGRCHTWWRWRKSIWKVCRQHLTLMYATNAFSFASPLDFLDSTRRLAQLALCVWWNSSQLLGNPCKHTLQPSSVVFKCDNSTKAITVPFIISRRDRK